MGKNSPHEKNVDHHRFKSFCPSLRDNMVFALIKKAGSDFFPFSFFEAGNFSNSRLVTIEPKGVGRLESFLSNPKGADQRLGTSHTTPGLA